jgi:hypothetical protein
VCNKYIDGEECPCEEEEEKEDKPTIKQLREDAASLAALAGKNAAICISILEGKSCRCGNDNLDELEEPMECKCGNLFCFDCGGDDQCDYCLSKEDEKPREDEQTCDECGDCGDFIIHKSKVKEDHFVCCICKKAEDEEQICKKLEALGVKIESKTVGSLTVRSYTYPATEPSKEIDELIKQLE